MSKFTKCPRGTEIQTLIFAKQSFANPQVVIAWAKEHDFKFGNFEVTPHTYRVRQQPAKSFRADGFRTITLTPGVQAVIGCPKKMEDGGGGKNFGIYCKQSFTLSALP